MREYSFTEARQHFASLLEKAKREGIVCIKKRDGESYIKPATPKKSPLDIKGVNLGINSSEIVDMVKRADSENTTSIAASVPHLLLAHKSCRFLHFADTSVMQTPKPVTQHCTHVEVAHLLSG